jgi:hypothetical protein
MVMLQSLSTSFFLNIFDLKRMCDYCFIALNVILLTAGGAVFACVMITKPLGVHAREYINATLLITETTDTIAASAPPTTKQEEGFGRGATSTEQHLWFLRTRNTG